MSTFIVQKSDFGLVGGVYFYLQVLVTYFGMRKPFFKNGQKFDNFHLNTYIGTPLNLIRKQMEEKSDELRLTREQFKSLGRLDSSLRWENIPRDKVCEDLCTRFGVRIVTVLGLNQNEEYSYQKISNK